MHDAMTVDLGGVADTSVCLSPLTAYYELLDMAQKAPDFKTFCAQVRRVRTLYPGIADLIVEKNEGVLQVHVVPLCDRGANGSVMPNGACGNFTMAIPHTWAHDERVLHDT